MRARVKLGSSTLEPMWRPLVRAAGLVALAALFALGAWLQATRVNVDATRHDQTAYIEYAFAIHVTHGESIGSRLQMPALPELLAVFWRDGDTPATFFPRAKWIAMAVGAVSATVAALLLWLRLPPRPALAVGLASVFFVFAFRAAYVQAEPMSYAATFALFLAMCEAWRKPSWPLAVLVGLLLAAAFMTKATALLGFYVFAAAVVVRALILARRSPRALVAPLQTAFSFAVFFAAIWPYAHNSRRLYGHWLYNLNTEYVMWCDSFEQFLDIQARLDVVHHAATLPPDQVPSATTFWRTHTIAQIAWHELRGLGEVIGNCFLSHGYAPFALLYGASFVLFVRQHTDVRSAIFRRDPSALAWFVVPYLAVHVLLFGWFGPIAAGNRFILSIFLPAMYSIAAALSAHTRGEHAIALGRRRFDWTRVNVALAVFLAAEILFYFPWAAATHYSGG